MREYLEDVLEGKLPVNAEIIHNLQDIFNLLPNLNQEEIIKNFSVKTNDYMHMTYVCSLIRSVISLHNLINNKIVYNQGFSDLTKEKKKKVEGEKEKKEPTEAK